MKLLKGNNIDLLKTLDDNSIDSIVTDPPYGLSFMNKKWDYDVPSTDFWKEVYRVLKPGGHILSFGGSRTYHRMAWSKRSSFEIDHIIPITAFLENTPINIISALDNLRPLDPSLNSIKYNHIDFDYIKLYIKYFDYLIPKYQKEIINYFI